MTGWKSYPSKSKNEKVSDLKSKYIVEQLGCLLPTIFNRTSRHRTKLIKVALALLGDISLNGKPHYKVYANKIPRYLRTCDGGNFKCKEWHYDLHWYEEVEGEKYMLKKLNLAVECEWRWTKSDEKVEPDKKKDYYGAVKYDFQKLLVANAELRLLIFRIRKGKKEERFKRLDEYFDASINKCESLPEDSKFLIVAFDEDERKFHYTEKVKGKKITFGHHRILEKSTSVPI